MSKAYIAVLLGGFITAIAGTAASYVNSTNTLSAHEVRITNLESASRVNSEEHVIIAEGFKEFSETNTEILVKLSRLTTIIELKLGDKNDS